MRPTRLDEILPGDEDGPGEDKKGGFNYETQERIKASLPALERQDGRAHDYHGSAADHGYGYHPGRSPRNQGFPIITVTSAGVEGSATITDQALEDGVRVAIESDGTRWAYLLFSGRFALESEVQAVSPDDRLIRCLSLFSQK